MKRLSAMFFIVILLTGCANTETPIEQALNLRESLLEAEETSFHACITADYQEALYSFEMDCVVDTNRNLSFTVTQPETISGISGIITNSQSALLFDDKVLAFPPFPDGEISPVMAPYFFLNSLVGGYISGCGKEKEGYCIYIDDSYMTNQIKTQVFTDDYFTPIRAEIIHRNQRILTIDINNFSFL